MRGITTGSSSTTRSVSSSPTRSGGRSCFRPHHPADSDRPRPSQTPDGLVEVSSQCRKAVTFGILPSPVVGQYLGHSVSLDASIYHRPCSGLLVRPPDQFSSLHPCSIDTIAEGRSRSVCPSSYYKTSTVMGSLNSSKIPPFETVSSTHVGNSHIPFQLTKLTSATSRRR